VEKMIQIFIIFGKKVNEIEVPEGTETMTVEVMGWRRGLYFLRLEAGGEERGSKKIVVN